MKYPENIKWVDPNQLTPGEDVLIHVMWVPKKQFDQFPIPPAPPADIVYGEWIATPYYPQPDRISNMDKMLEATVGLFQDDEDTLSVVGKDMKTWAIPRDCDFILAKDI